MKNYVITIGDIEQSVKAANRCISSGKRFESKIEKFDAVTPRNTNVEEKLKELGLPMDSFAEKYSRMPNCIAAFLSHFTLWDMCRESGEEFHIFEHDAILVDYLPNNIQYNGCISLGKPSYGSFRIPPILGVNTLSSKFYFPGAHAYRLKPKMADMLIQEAYNSAAPTDVFLDIRRFPFLQEFYPWPVEVRESFTTIQKVDGCWAKHGFNNEYKII